jgi:hypothetical protein
MNIARTKDILIVDDYLDRQEVSAIRSLVLENKWSNEKNNRVDPDGKWYKWRDLTQMYLGNERDYRANQVKSIQNKIMKFCEEQLPHYSELEMDYCGVAAQTAPFCYHADAEYPELEHERDLGMPDSNTFNYKKPTSKFIPNYCPLRSYTSVIYLNEDLEGGETVLPDYQVEAKPKIGRMIAFPSSSEYIHGVRPTTQGTRYTFIAWYKKKMASST